MSQAVKLTIPSDPKFLSLVRNVVQHLLAMHEVPTEVIRRLVLCIDEACSNIIKYSYEGDCQEPIEMEFRLENHDFVARIRDYGKQCDSRRIKPRPLTRIEPGGLGTFFINEIMDEVNYCTNRDRGTLLTMHKHLKDELTSSEERK